MSFSILPEITVVFVLMMARIGTLVMLLPGLGERLLPMNVRLAAALLLTLVFFPLVQPYYPTGALTIADTARLLMGELMVGFVMGITGRLLLSCLQTAGTIVAQQLGLGFVTSVDPTQGQQGALLGSFFTIAGLALIFATDLHHLVITAIGHSYEAFRPGTIPDTGDGAQYVIQLTASAFKMGVQIAAPLVVFGLVFNVGLGLLARMMPQMQVFFVVVPASIMLGFAVLALVFASMMGVFIEFMRDGLNALLGG